MSTEWRQYLYYTGKNAAVDTGEPPIPNADNPKKNLTFEERMALINDRVEANAKVQVMKQQNDYNKNITDPNLKAHHKRHSSDFDNVLFRLTILECVQ